MGSLIDDVSKALASGASRRAAVATLLAGSAAALPWTSEAKQNQKKRRRKFKKYLEFCRQWCGFRDMPGSKQFKECVDKAKEGKGACYATGPGHYCLDRDCPESWFCCPDIENGDRVTTGRCCKKMCEINSTDICT